MLETDYLIVGAGALGMTFADQMLTDSDADLILVDRHDMPGGHWNDAYPFVRLHQPSAFYGVGSRVLGSNLIDETGFNKGYYELASGPGIQAYFDGLMRERFLPSGRVRYFPMSDYQGEGKVKSLLSGKTQTIHVRKKTVDATFFNTSVPSTHEPKYQVAEGVKCITPNALPRQAIHHRFYTIIGGGKTAMDVGVWLLQNEVSPKAIRWIVPRDSWLINRETTQPGDVFSGRSMDSRASYMEAAAHGHDVEDVFERLEKSGQMLRLDPDIRPTMYHNATMSKGEIEALRTIGHIVRKGHVQKIEPEAIILKEGTVESRPGDLYIDCTARAFDLRQVRPIFKENLITLQMIRAGLFCFSAAMIAHVEAAREGLETQNRLCPPMAAADSPLDWLKLQLGENELHKRWSTDKDIRNTAAAHRLSGANLRGAPPAEPDEETLSIRARIRAAAPHVEDNLERIIASHAL